MSRIYFFEELKRYTRFEDFDTARALELVPILTPKFDRVSETFYQAILRNPRTESIFESSEQIALHQELLNRWLAGAFGGQYDESYLESRLRIGRRHAEVGLLPHFIFGAMSLIRNEIYEILSDGEPSERGHRERIETVDRILDMELAIMIQSYWDTLMTTKLKMPMALASGLAHEIRNPLNAIALNLTLLERKINQLQLDVDSSTPIVDSIRTEIQRIGTLTSEIMDFAKPIAISPYYHKASMVLNRLIVAHGGTLKESNIDFKTELKGDDLIYVDHDRLTQVFLNLITNAVQALVAREKDGTIRLAIDNTQEATTIVRFTDNGQGMSSEVRERLFDLFYTTKASGTGLGMPIVQKIVDAHNGMIHVSSQVGEGTTVEIYIPRPSRTLEQKQIEQDNP